MKQKEALKILIEDYSPVIKKFFISEWLEYINWRSENNLFNRQYVTDIERLRINLLSDLHLVKYTCSYPKRYVTEDMSTATSYQNILNSGDRIYLVSDQITTSAEELIDYHRARKEVRTFSKIFRWRICNEDWNSNGSATKFVSELAALANNK